ncbi:hypothetical protein ABV409_14430 [Flagellimonas sp. DF-77]|uniref:hypothetical protein n=1 Tax=Flagellimonas algarum TaxID=3230298 RepID=UPI0033940772
MTALRLEIPFEKATYLSQIDLLFPLVYADLIQKLRIQLLLGLVLILIGTALLYAGHDFGAFPLIIGLLFGYEAYRIYREFSTKRKGLKTRAIENLESNKGTITKGVFEFLDNALRYSDDLTESIIPWSDFQGFRIVKGNALLIVDQRKGNILVFGEKEVGQEPFRKAVALLKTKL